MVFDAKSFVHLNGFDETQYSVEQYHLYVKYS